MKKVLIAIATLAFMASISAVQSITKSECAGELSEDVATGDIYCCLGPLCEKCSDCTTEDVIIFQKKVQPNVKAPRSPLKRQYKSKTKKAQ